MLHMFSGITPERYIWVSVSGSDSNTGTESSPLRTIQKAITLATPGTAIMVEAGTYTENVNITKNGTPTAPIWLISADGAGQARVVPASTSEDTIKANGIENIVIQGFDVTQPGPGDYGIKISQNGANFSDLPRHIVIIGNSIHGSGKDGIHVNSADDIQVLDNVIDGAIDQGIDFVAVNDSLIAGNEVRNVTGSAGIQVKGGSTNVVISGNEIHGADDDGLRIGGGTGEAYMRPGYNTYEAKNVVAIGNEIYDVGERGVWFMGAQDSRLEGNWFHGLTASAKIVNLVASTVHNPPFDTKNITIQGNSFERANWLVVEAGQGSGLVVAGNLTDGSPPPGFGEEPPPPPVVPELSIAAVSHGEGDAGTANAVLTLTLSAAATNDVVVTYATTAGTAAAGSDYVGVASGSVTIPAGATSATLAVAIVGDGIVEADEQFAVTLTGVSSNAVLGAQSSATVTILDDDTATVSLAGASVMEGDSGTTNAVLAVTLSQPSSTATVVTYQTAPGTADGSDFVGVSAGAVTIAAGQTGASIAIAVTGDILSEESEIFSVALTGVSGDPAIALAAQSSATVTILDSDAAPAAVVSIAGASVEEGNSGTTNAAFTVTLSHPSATPTTITYATAPATAGAADFASVSGSLAIPAGQTTGTIVVAVTGDTLVEADEQFTVSLTGVSGNATLGAQSSAAATILDNDAAVVLIAAPSVAEGNSGATNAAFTVTLSQPASTATTITYATSPGTAGASDFVGTSGSLTIPGGQTTGAIVVAVSGDSLVEADEGFTVTLTGVSGDPQITLAAQSAATGTIVDDDAASVSVAPTSVQEGNTGTTTAVFTVTLSQAASTPTTVSYGTSPGTAGADDFTSVSGGSVVISAGQTSATIAIAVTGDTIDEVDETFVLALTGVSGDPAIGLGAESSAVATIVDDDTTQGSGGPPGNDSLVGTTGANTLVGGPGDDIYVVDNAGDVVVEFPGEGTDLVQGWVTATLAANVENLSLMGSALNATGNALANAITGNAKNNLVRGLEGNDTLNGNGGNDTIEGAEGNDSLNGGSSNDRLIGGAGRDSLTGGSGADTFAYASASDSEPTAGGRDVITDFSASSGDRIDLSAIDARTDQSGDQPFAFIGTSTFGGTPGQLRYTASSSTTIVEGDLNGDRAADFQIELTGQQAPASGAFIL